MSTDDFISIERAALDRWGNGDPSGFLETYAPEVTYFDTATERRIDGLEAMTEYYRPFRGQINIREYEMIGPKVLEAYDGRILNIHPALLPKFGGHGMFGQHVHRAVLDAGETVTGVTIHLVNSEYDQGRIIAQAEVPVLPDDTVESLAARVLKKEHEFFAQTLQEVVSGRLEL